MKKRLIVLGTVLCLGLCSACGSNQATEERAASAQTETTTEKTEQASTEESLNTEEVQEEVATPEPTVEPTPEPTPETETVYLTSKSISYDGDGNVTSTTVFEYDEFGEVVKQETTGEYSSFEAYENEYDEAGNLSKSTCYDESGALTYYTTYEYDANGNQLKYINYDAEGNKGMSIEYEYDANGNMTKFIMLEADDQVSNWHEYVYDGNNMLSSTAYGSEGKITSKQEYEYDADGVQIGMVDTFMFQGEALVTNEKYEYDANGNKIKAVTLGSDGDIYTINEFEYDANGNETKSISRDGSGEYVFYVTEHEYIALEIEK